MTTPVLTETSTARDLLFGGEPAAPADALKEALREHGTLVTLAGGFPGVLPLAEHEVAREANDLLSLDLFDLILVGWKTYEALREAARRTRDAHNTEKVALATHRIESSQNSTIEVFVDGTSAGTLDVELSIAFDIAAVRAVVCEGRLTTIETGTCTVTGAFAIKDTELAKRAHEFDLPGAVHLRGGVALLAPSTSTPASWCPDPTRRHELRWWDGSRWTQRVATRGRESSDPIPAG